ncbi:ArsR/SmtB family transcription factor [Actinophytocola sp.]|uniref:ArsR/SmtB family transcription factor n=1 Tax=Actinophytocola sp. TaxID=1872138 RepID=UPI002ED224EB
MLELSFTAADVAYTRFALSPLWEVVASVRVLKSAVTHDLHGRWVVQARDRLRGFDWRPLGDLVPTRVIPGFLCPPPTSPLPDLDSELAILRATPAEQVAREVAVIPEITSVPPEVDALAEMIEEYWDRALAPFWPRIQRLLEADVQYRARRLTMGGASALFADLNPAVRWREDRLFIDHVTLSARRGLRGKGLLLVPSVFAWPRVSSITVPGWQPTLRYPPRGVAELWVDRKVTPPQALVGVFGTTRARLLAELDNPASTTDLARRTGLTAGGVSQHLTALKAAGLLSAHRVGRQVLYSRTAVTEELFRT